MPPEISRTLLLIWLLPWSALAAEETAEPEPAPDARETAVALNYCRAAFHRIRRNPTKPVLVEEQEKILNNINLNGIADREVVQLYSSVLDEINQVSVADYERNLVRDHHNSSIQRKVVWDILAIGADAAAGQFGNAIRSGANSWWDYRNMQYQQDADLLKVDKARLNSVVQKSTQFLDTFWQMARKKNIPDRWLVRGDDLDALEAAMHERDPQVRLRILRRMEPFMEAYPPYWYYLARTQQELGQLFAAEDTYVQLASLGDGHFRRDDMLATGLANQAAIQEFLGQKTAAETATRALAYSTDVWEANLVCARILERQHRFAAAEDAILRNLDVGLETAESRIFLVTHYYVADEDEKLLSLLQDRELVAGMPAPVLLRCAAKLGTENTPPHVLRTVFASLQGQPRVQFGRDDFILRASSAWMLHLASLNVIYQGNELANPEVTSTGTHYQLRYAGGFEWGSPLNRTPDNMRFEVRLTYPDQTVIRMVLQPGPVDDSLLPPMAPRVASTPPLRITAIEVGDARTPERSSGLDVRPVSLRVEASAVPDVEDPVTIPLPPTVLGDQGEF